MVQNIPQSDSFTENSGGFGSFFCSYIRLKPWSVASIGGYTCPSAEGTLNQGYLVAGAGGVAFTDTTTPAVPGGFCATTWRALYNFQQTSELGFALHTVNGAETDDSFRTVGVCVRSQGGTFVDTFQHERHENHSAYWLLFQNTLVSGVLWQLVRVNSGTPTVIASQAIATPSLAYIGAGKRITLSVRNSAGSPVLTAHFTEPDGSNDVTLFGGAIVDLDPAKITTAGRAGFGMTRDRAEAGATNTATIATYFRVVDDSIATEHLRDEWTRNPRHGYRSLTQITTVTDGNGINGRPSQSLWGSDLFAQRSSAAARQPVDTPNNRLKSTTSPNANTCFFWKGYPPVCGLCTDVSYVYTQTSTNEFETRLYMFDFGPLATPQRLEVRLVGSQVGGPLNYFWHFIDAGLFLNDPSGLHVPWVLGGTNTIRWTASLSGTAPTRLQTFRLFVNGVQVPFHLSLPGIVAGWSVAAPGDVSWSETAGPLWVNRGGGAIVQHFASNPDLDVDYLDTWIDTPTSCCATAPIVTAPSYAWVAPSVNVTLINPTVQTIQPTPFAWLAPAVQVQLGAQARFPAGQSKFGGAVAGTSRYGGAVAGGVGLGE